MLMWRMNFEVECNLYKPELPVGVPIKRVITRFSATQDTQNSGIELDNVITAQTVDTETPGVTSCEDICYADLDAEIVSYIRRYTEGEFALQEQMRPYIDCAFSKQDKEEPPVPPVEYPKFPSGMFQVTELLNEYVIDNADLGLDYNVVVNVFDSNGSPIEIPVNISKEESRFIINLYPEIGYNIVWYTYPVYNRRE